MFVPRIGLCNLNIEGLKTLMPSRLTVEKDVVFHSDLETVHRVVLETERYPEFIKNIKSAHLIQKHEDQSEVAFKAKVSFFPFEYSIKTIKISDALITFEQNKGFFGFLNGEWRLKESNGCVEGKYVVNVVLPRFVASRIVEKAINLYFPDMLNDFKREIERRFKVR